MGIYDRDWHKDERRQKREQERAQERKQQAKANHPTRSNWPSETGPGDMKTALLWMSIGLNLILGIALVLS